MPAPGWLQRRWKVVLAVVLLVGYGLSGGCYAARLPPSPGPEQAALLREAPLPYTVVVVPWEGAAAAAHTQNPEAYANAALRWLQGSGAFAHVRLGTSQDPDADLLASSTGAYCNANPIPLFTILSLGIFPTIFTDTDCEGAALYPRHPMSGSADSVVITRDISSRSMMGWLAVPVGLLPGWTHGDIRDHARTRAQSRLAILEYRARLAQLASPR